MSWFDGYGHAIVSQHSSIAAQPSSRKQFPVLFVSHSFCPRCTDSLPDREARPPGSRRNGTEREATERFSWMKPHWHAQRGWPRKLGWRVCGLKQSQRPTCSAGWESEPPPKWPFFEIFLIKESVQSTLCTSMYEEILLSKRSTKSFINVWGRYLPNFQGGQNHRYKGGGLPRFEPNW